MLMGCSLSRVAVTVVPTAISEATRSREMHSSAILSLSRSATLRSTSVLPSALVSTMRRVQTPKFAIAPMPNGLGRLGEFNGGQNPPGDASGVLDGTGERPDSAHWGSESSHACSHRNDHRVRSRSRDATGSLEYHLSHASIRAAADLASCGGGIGDG